MKTQRLSLISGAVILALGLSTSALANTTTSAIKGQISGPQGNPAAGTAITIVHVPSGSTKNATVNESGLFTAKGLRVGGPYKIIIDSDKFNDKTVNDVFLTLGETYPVNVSLDAKQTVERIEVTGRTISRYSGGTGPAAHFGLEDLENAPAINRDIKDIVRVDPRIYIDESQGDAIQCGGGNPRFNSLTLDGVRMNDSFGLNRNGYPTTRIPFSYDSIEQVAVELAPFDVKYGGFTSCNVNAVTKSGGNEVHGAFFYDYTNDSMKGDSIEGEKFENGNFSEKRYGLSVGFPILEDKLFMFASYEKLEGAKIFEYNPFGDNVSQADLDRIKQITSDVYGYDAGDLPASLPVEDEKLLVKVDWNINDSHRASLIYNYNDGFDLDQSDDWALTLDSHFYERGAELNSLVGSLYSDWTDDFSTELRIGKVELDNRQNSLDAASGFGEVQIRHGGTTVFLGPDDSRQSNEMNTETVSLRFSGDYYLDEHTITFGYEYEEVTAFNLFMQHTQGEFRFDSIDDYEAGMASRVYYNNSAGTNVPSDASQEFSFQQHTIYAQDEYTFADVDMTLMVGFRYDMYTSDDKPRYNQNFVDRYGFANDGNMDDKDLFQPRVGFNWAAMDNLEIRGGFGLYSGGNPNVWVSNAYSNDGIVQIGLRENGVDLFNTTMTNGDGPGFGVPQSMFDEIQNYPVGGGDGAVNAIDPNFELPSEWKYALGGTYTFDNDVIVAVDLLHNQKKDTATIKDYAIQRTGEQTFDGRPLYENKEGWRTGDFVLTNSDQDGKSTILSFAVSKDFDWGLNATLSYAYTKSQDTNPMTSSVAGSNYGNIATTVPDQPPMETSNYEVPHRFTLNLSYVTQLIDNLDTRFSLFGSASEGQPYTYTFDSSDGAWGDSNWNGSRQMLYVPAANDANVVYDAGFDKAAFDAFVEAEGLARGATVGRNSQNADWFVKFDLKVSQEIPGLYEGQKGSAFFVVKNVGNFLNDDWGIMKQGQFVGNRMVEMSMNDAGQYVYEEFNEGNEEQEIYNDASLWEIRFGVRYTF
ncbi:MULTISPECIES: TonB-dependent receptor [Thalassotalea]|uniref:TonB-dependent receptor n=1 Tax=Thalassotalea castellviae TaxID=3075612 RepID=A0ABU3A4I9_9GAMM|nr:TonB-dependent receptor [Thalassotalea sp. W431]MDT0604815.1 TonB-dependent receptor [Thalassotalea sp. W431]